MHSQRTNDNTSKLYFQHKTLYEEKIITRWASALPFDLPTLTLNLLLCIEYSRYIVGYGPTAVCVCHIHIEVNV